MSPLVEERAGEEDAMVAEIVAAVVVEVAVIVVVEIAAVIVVETAVHRGEMTAKAEVPVVVPSAAKAGAVLTASPLVLAVSARA